ncbi:MAG TPA: sugar MFS transporter [Terracidiphilus sp.]|jgi:FHS family L-fucose permease-like MFS transporter|nr:sugar MFS transporter [Terracidiphilus sp.]
MATRSTPPAATSNAPSYLGPFIAVAALYFIFGFVTNLNMGLVPYLKQIFEVHNFRNWQAMLAEGAFFTAYFVCSSPSAKLIEAIGYKRTMVVSLFIQVIGALLFLPAAQQVSFPLFLAAIFVVGAGVTALQTAANPYIAILGPEHSAPVRLNLAQALNSLGGTIAPWVAGAFILTSKLTDPKQMALETPSAQHAYQLTIAHTVRMPYIVIAFGLVVLGIAIALIHLPHVTATQEFRPGKEGDAILKRSIWSYRHTVLGALGIFLYVGVEVGLATAMVLYFSDSTHGGLNALTVPVAQKLVLYYWLGALIGRLLGSWILTRVNAGKLLGIFGVIAASLVLVSIFTTGNVAIGALILAGFFNSVMFPNIFALGIAGLGPMTSKGSGLIMTAVWGGALIPVFIGWLSDNFTYEVALVVPVICYLYIAFYGFAGHKPSRTLPPPVLAP